MNMTTKLNLFIPPGSLRVLCVLVVLASAAPSYGQRRAEPRVPREVAVRFVSAELTRFERPVRVGAGKRTEEYREALVLKLAADSQEFDSLPPSIEPYLYIGRNEYRIFHIDRPAEGRQLLLTFHIRNWEKLTDQAPVVLTTDHGGPLRRPEEFARRAAFRFRRDSIVDRR